MNFFQKIKQKFAIRKGVGGLSDNAIALVVVAVTIGIGATVLANIQATQTTNGAAYNASKSGLQALGTFSDNLTTLALVIVFGIILFFLGRFLVSRRG